MRPVIRCSIFACTFSIFALASCNQGFIEDPNEEISSRSAPLWLPDGYILEDDQLIPISEDQSAFPTGVSTWTKGVVYYTFNDPEYTTTQKSFIRKALQAYTSAARIRFVERDDQPYYIGFKLDDTTGGSSYANVGMIGADQTVAFYPDSATNGRTVLHEVGHSLGRWHEHQRPDRDNYVTILEDNIVDGENHNFEIRPTIPTVLPYDFDSVMHYRKSAFGIRACTFCSQSITIDPLPAYDAYENTMGNLPGLSNLDRQVMISRYGEPALDHDLPHTSMSADKGDTLYFALEIPAQTHSVKITTAGGSGDLDLYLRAGQKPTTSSYDKSSTTSANQETIEIQSPAVGIWYVGMYSYSDFSDASIQVELTRDECTVDPVCAPNLPAAVSVGPFDIVRGERRLLKLEVPEGTGELHISSTGGSGDIDLYLGHGSVASPLDFDAKAFGHSNEEALILANPAAGTYYLTLYGYQSGTLQSIHLNLSSQADTFTNDSSISIRDHSGSVVGITDYPVDVSRSGDSGMVRVKTIYDHSRQSDLTIVLRAPNGTEWILRDQSDDQRVMPDIYNIDANGVDSQGTWTLAFTDHIRGPFMVSATAKELALTFAASTPVAECGNGVTEAGEDCDGGACCADDCRFLTNSSICRAADGECDQAETCTGSNSNCPADILKPDGSSCSVGVCQQGECSEPTSGTVVSIDENDLSAAKSEKLRFVLEVPANGSDILIKITQGTGDADLYVRKDVTPTTTAYDCRPYETGNEESCTGGGPGTYHIMVLAYESFTGLNLIGSYFSNYSECGNGQIETGEECDGGECCQTNCSYLPEGTECSLGICTAGVCGEESQSGTFVVIDQSDLSGARSSEQRFSMDIPADATLVEVLLAGGTGDADLYVKKDAAPSTSSYDCRSWNNGNTEDCQANGPGTYHILIKAYEAYSNANLLGRYTLP